MNLVNLPVRPVGLDAVVDAVEGICAKAAVYRRMKPGHFLIDLPAGSGQTTVTEYIDESFKACKIIHPDQFKPYLEFTTDGTMDQIQNMFGTICSHTVGTPQYEKVVAVNITALAAHPGGDQTVLFFRELRRLCSDAVAVLYIDPAARGAAALIRKVTEELDNVRVIHAAPYKAEELAAITARIIEECCVEIRDKELFLACLSGIIAEQGITTPKDCMSIARRAMAAADCNDLEAVICAQHLEEAFGLEAGKGAVK